MFCAVPTGIRSFDDLVQSSISVPAIAIAEILAVLELANTGSMVAMLSRHSHVNLHRLLLFHHLVFSVPGLATFAPLPSFSP